VYGSDNVSVEAWWINSCGDRVSLGIGKRTMVPFGAIVHVKADALDYPYFYWTAPGTMIDGSGSLHESFTFTRSETAVYPNATRSSVTIQNGGMCTISPPILGRSVTKEACDHCDGFILSGPVGRTASLSVTTPEKWVPSGWSHYDESPSPDTETYSGGLTVVFGGTDGPIHPHATIEGCLSPLGSRSASASGGGQMYIKSCRGDSFLFGTISELQGHYDFYTRACPYPGYTLVDVTPHDYPAANKMGHFRTKPSLSLTSDNPNAGYCNADPARAYYTKDEVVCIIATPASCLYEFKGWMGNALAWPGCTPYGAAQEISGIKTSVICVKMTGSRTIKASFTRNTILDGIPEGKGTDVARVTNKRDATETPEDLKLIPHNSTYSQGYAQPNYKVTVNSIVFDPDTCTFKPGDVTLELVVRLDYSTIEDDYLDRYSEQSPPSGENAWGASDICNIKYFFDHYFYYKSPIQPEIYLKTCVAIHEKTHRQQYFDLLDKPMDLSKMDLGIPLSCPMSSTYEEMRQKMESIIQGETISVLQKELASTYLECEALCAEMPALQQYKDAFEERFPQCKSCPQMSDEEVKQKMKPNEQAINPYTGERCQCQ
jgi:hypothetical protein